ncbi:histidine phosphatase family protein [Rhodococcoides fascians]|uniref:histidine phosphatase family protein n=1 Tax=Rhodococcoides fascians TaxID=1828 RepID=UPI00353050D3
MGLRRLRGITSSEIHETVPHWTVWTHPCPGGESIGDIAVRVELVLSVVLPLLEGRDVVLVGHGHFSRALMPAGRKRPSPKGSASHCPRRLLTARFRASFRQLSPQCSPSILSAATIVDRHRPDRRSTMIRRATEDDVSAICGLSTNWRSTRSVLVVHGPRRPPSVGLFGENPTVFRTSPSTTAWWWGALCGS